MGEELYVHVQLFALESLSDGNAHISDRSFNDKHSVWIGMLIKGGSIALLLHFLLMLGTVYRLNSLSEHRIILLAIFSSGLVFTCFDDDNFFKHTLPFWLSVLIPVACSFSVNSKEETNEVG